MYVCVCHMYKCIMCFIFSWYSDKSAESHFMIHEKVSETPSQYADWTLTFMHTHACCKCTMTVLLPHSYHQSAFSSLWQIKTSTRQQLGEIQSCGQDSDFKLPICLGPFSTMKAVNLNHNVHCQWERKFIWVNQFKLWTERKLLLISVRLSESIFKTINRINILVNLQTLSQALMERKKHPAVENSSERMWFI